MFSFLISLGLSIYLPYSDTERIAIQFWDNETINNYSANIPNFALLVVNPNDPDNTYGALASFASAGSLVSKDIVIGYTYPSEIQEIMESFEGQLPIVMCISNGQVFTSFELPSQETYILKQLDSIFYGPMDMLESPEDCNKYLTNLDYTIIARANNIDDAMYLLEISLPQLGTCGIILGSTKMFETIGAADYPFAIFRRDDLVIAPIENSTESLLNASIPYYAIFSDEDFADPETIVVGLMNPDMVENQEISDALFEISTKFPEVKVGIITDQQMNYAYRMIDYIPEKFPALAIFNFEQGYYYSTGFLQNITIGPEWTEKVVDLLNGILNGTVKKMLLSEDIPQTQENPNFVKVVGKNFDEFISDNEKSSCIMFINGNKIDGFSDVFEEIANEFNKNGTDKIKFGFFNILTNAAESMPRLLRVPHVELFIAGKNKSVPMLDILNRNGFIRFLAENLPELNIEAPKMENEDGWSLIRIYSKNLNQYGGKDRELLENYINELTKKMPPMPEMPEDEEYSDDEEVNINEEL